MAREVGLLRRAEAGVRVRVKPFEGGSPGIVSQAAMVSKAPGSVLIWQDVADVHGPYHLRVPLEHALALAVVDAPATTTTRRAQTSRLYTQA